MEWKRPNQSNHNNRMPSKKCTDIRWLLLLITFWVLLIIIGVFAVIYGNYIAHIKGYDSFGNLCGERDNQPYNNFTLSGTDTSTKPYLHYFSYGNLSNVFTLCVESCNNKMLDGIMDIYDFYKHNKTSVCRYDFQYSLLLSDSRPTELANKWGPCPSAVINICILLKRRCVPMDLMYVYSSHSYEHINLGDSSLQVFFSYVYLWRTYIFALGFFALNIAGVLLCVIWLQEKVRPCLMGFVCAVATLSICGEVCYIYLHLPNEIDDFLHDWHLATPRMLYTFMEDLQLNKCLVYGFLACCLLTTEGLLVVFILSRSYIDPTVIVLKEAVKCCKDVPQLVHFSLISSVVLGAFYSLFSYVLICSSSASERKALPFIVKENEMGDKQYFHLRQLEKLTFVPIAAIQNSSFVHIFGFIWTAKFIFACEQFCLETLATQWYWRTKSRSRMHTIIWTLIRHHLGSAARRSFLEMLTIPRFALTFICQMSREWCCSSKRLGQQLESFERILRVPHLDVYAFRASEPAQHCRSGPVESLLMEATQEKLEGIRCLVYITLLTIKVTVVLVTGLVGMFLLNGQEELYLYMSPVIWSSILAFCIAHMILSVIETPMATILFCILESQQGTNNAERKSEQNALEPDIIEVVNQTN